jgi:hypothetical protein
LALVRDDDTLAPRMPIKLSGRYEPGSPEERAHRLLQQSDVEVDRVYGVDVRPSGQHEITFTHDGKAQTAFVENEVVVLVLDGWDVTPPKSGAPAWRGD